MLNKRQSAVSNSASGTGTGVASASLAPSSAQPSSLAPSTGPLTSASPTSPSASSLTLSPSSAITRPSSSLVTTPLSTIAPSSSPSPSSLSSPSSAVVPTSTPSQTSSFVSSAADHTSSLNRPVSTFSSTVFLQTTNSLGQSTSFAPVEITSTFTSTLGNGGLVTFTEVVANPTLSANDRASSGNQFLHNKGAVAAVFLIVGLAAATICLWIFFFIRRRRRRRRVEHELALSESLAAAGYNRSPIDDEDFPPGPGMQQRVGSFGSQPSISTPITDDERAAEAAMPTVNLFDPYVGYGHPVGGTGYIPARSESPSQHGRAGTLDDSPVSGASKRLGPAHVLQYDMGGADQLLTGVATSPEGAPGPSQITPTPPPRNPKRQQSPEKLGRSGLQGPDERPPPDYRLNPTLSVTQRAERKGWQELRDDVDYSRPVLE